MQGTQNRSPKTGTRPNGPVQARNVSAVNAAAAKENAALLKQLKHSNKAFESLAVLFKYCTNDVSIMRMFGFHSFNLIQSVQVKQFLHKKKKRWWVKFLANRNQQLLYVIFESFSKKIYFYNLLANIKNLTKECKRNKSINVRF